MEDQREVQEGDEGGYPKNVYHNRSKEEIVFSVVKRAMSEDTRSVRTKARNNELRFRVIASNANRIATLAYSLIRGFLMSLREPICSFQNAGILFVLATDFLCRRNSYQGSQVYRRNGRILYFTANVVA